MKKISYITNIMISYVVLGMSFSLFLFQENYTPSALFLIAYTLLQRRRIYI